MGVVQSKRRTKNHNLDLSSSPTRPQHASLFTERSASYTGEPTNGKRSTHHSTLPRHAIRSISDDVVLVKRNNTLAVRNNKARRQLQPEGYVGVESTSRFLPEDWEAQDRDISVCCYYPHPIPHVQQHYSMSLVTIVTFCAETAIGWVINANENQPIYP